MSATPVAVCALGLLALGLLDLAGAECVYPNTPHALDGEATCNGLGSIRDEIGWSVLLVGVVTLPVAAILLVGGAAASWLRRRRYPRNTSAVS